MVSIAAALRSQEIEHKAVGFDGVLAVTRQPSTPTRVGNTMSPIACFLAGAFNPHGDGGYERGHGGAIHGRQSVHEAAVYAGLVGFAGPDDPE